MIETCHEAKSTPAIPAVSAPSTKHHVRMLGQADAGPARRLGVAADRIHVAAESGPLEQGGPAEEHDEDDRDDERQSVDDPEMGAVDVADGHDDNAGRGGDDDLEQGQARGRRNETGAAAPAVPVPLPAGRHDPDDDEQDPADQRAELPPDRGGRRRPRR